MNKLGFHSCHYMKGFKMQYMYVCICYHFRTTDYNLRMITHAAFVHLKQDKGISIRIHTKDHLICFHLLLLLHFFWHLIFTTVWWFGCVRLSLLLLLLPFPLSLIFLYKNKIFDGSEVARRYTYLLSLFLSLFFSLTLLTMSCNFFTLSLPMLLASLTSFWLQWQQLQ